MYHRVVSVLSIAALAVALVNIPLASAAHTGLTVDLYIVPAPNGTATITKHTQWCEYTIDILTYKRA